MNSNKNETSLKQSISVFLQTADNNSAMLTVGRNLTSLIEQVDEVKKILNDFVNKGTPIDSQKYFELAGSLNYTKTLMEVAAEAIS